MANIMTCILDAFTKIYTDMPPIKTYETKFVSYILGIIVNLTNTKAGRNFFTQVNEGISVINAIITLVVCAAPSLENNLKK